MLPFQERKKFRKILYSKASILVLLVALVLVSRGAWQVHEKAAIARTERNESARMLADLQDRNSALETSLVRLKSDQGIEDEVRQKYAVARPGEEIVIVVDESSKKSKNGDEALQKSFWQRFISLFTGE
jgi:cell division protein FtsB